MNRIKELRTERGMKQADLAELLHIGRTAISNYELEARALDPNLINQLCDIFHVTADYLLCRTASPLAGITEEEYTVLMAYRRADDRTRCMVDLALEPFAAKKAASAG
jgi:transcriptional regulator with XRE-family HTH domain